MEIVATLAVGTASARAYYLLLAGRDVLNLIGPTGFVRAVGGAGLMGLAVAGGLGLAIETLVGSEKRSWGVGRWVWCISGFVVVLNILARLADLLLGRGPSLTTSPIHPGGPLSAEAIKDAFLGMVPGLLNDEFPLFLAAFCLTAYLRREFRDSNRDLREWSGLIFASLVVAQRFAIGVLTK